MDDAAPQGQYHVAMTGLKKGALVVAASMLLLGIGLTKRVNGEDMSPSITEGDWVFMLPAGIPLPGEVVRITDPLDQKRTILRRVLAIGGQSITIDEGQIRVNKRRLRASAMGDMGPHLVTSETLWAKRPATGASWLTRAIAEPPSQWTSKTVDVPDGHVFLMADNRDGPLDSRWWGPVPQSAITGIIRVRLGPAHTWRPRLEFLAGTPPLGT